jgi:hypothetical protein
MQIYSEEDRSKMPPELANALSHNERLLRTLKFGNRHLRLFI